MENKSEVIEIKEQILIPKQVFVGDSFILVCNFKSDKKIIQNKCKIEFTFESENEKIQKISEIETKKIEISQKGEDFYELQINATAWKTGELIIPELKITQNDDLEILLKLQPIQISSITEEKKITELQRELPPFLLPGTIYRLLGSFVICLILLFFLIILLKKRDKLIFGIKNLILKIKYFFNKKNTIKSLENLLKNHQDEKSLEMQKIICEKIQYIIRKYLENRYFVSFAQISTSELQVFFNEITQNLLSEEKQNGFEQIVSVFIRTDFFRYSGTQQEFSKAELQQIICVLIDSINILEKND